MGKRYVFLDFFTEMNFRFIHLEGIDLCSLGFNKQLHLIILLDNILFKSLLHGTFREVKLLQFFLRLHLLQE